MARKNLLKDIKKPKSVAFEAVENNGFYGKFVAAPFERGFGITVGNTLRRTLLSILKGYSVTAVKITYYNDDGSSNFISSEFEQIPGMLEDTIEFIANLKQLALNMDDNIEQRVITLEHRGVGQLTAASLAVDDSIRVINSDLVLANTEEKANFIVDLQIELGHGYLASDSNGDRVDEIGAILIDAVFSPVRWVNFQIENTRVGQHNDFDKLILEVETDGTISPKMAVAEASKVIKEHFTTFIDFDEDTIAEFDEANEEEERIKTILQTPVEELELSVRSSNCLKNSNIRFIGELIQKTEEDISLTRNFGRVSLNEIKQKLSEWGLYLGMTDYSSFKSKDKVDQEKDTVNE